MSNPLPMLNGDKTGVGDFSTDASANMVAAIRDHISCTKPVQVDTFVTQDTKSGLIYPCDFDHMYASLAEGAVAERENLEVKHLKELLLLHLDLIQQQSEQLVTKEKQIASLRQENETLRQRLERMDRRVNLHKQRDPLAPACDAAAVAMAAPAPLPPLDGGFLVPKAEPAMLSAQPPTVMLASYSASPQQYFRPPSTFQNTFEPFEDVRQSQPLPTFVQTPPMQLCELSETDGRVPGTSFATALPASETSTSYAAPPTSFAAPATSYAPPPASFIAPANSFAAPANSFATPTNFVDPSTSFTDPSATFAVPPTSTTSYAVPATSFAVPANSFAVPANSFADPSTFAAPPTSFTVPATSLADPTTSFADTATVYSEPEAEPAKRRKTDEMEPPLQPVPAQVETATTERVPGTGQDAGADAALGQHLEGLEADSERGVPTWIPCSGRRQRRPLVRHGRSDEGESSVAPPPATEGLVRRGRRLLRSRHGGRRSGGRSGRRRLGSAAKDVLCTDQPYWTTVGELPSVLRLHDGLRSECANVEVPSWRHKVYTSCYAMEGTENLDDEVFSKRHQRYESDERRRKRWDVQRIREQRHVEKLRQQQAARATTTNTTRSSGSHRDDCPLASLWPSPEDVTFVEIGEKLPVAAFGAPVVNFHPNEFCLPWKWRTPQQEKSQRRSLR